MCSFNYNRIDDVLELYVTSHKQQAFTNYAPNAQTSTLHVASVELTHRVALFMHCVRPVLYVLAVADAAPIDASSTASATTATSSATTTPTVRNRLQLDQIMSDGEFLLVDAAHRQLRAEALRRALPRLFNQYVGVQLEYNSLRHFVCTNEAYLLQQSTIELVSNIDVHTLIAEALAESSAGWITLAPALINGLRRSSMHSGPGAQSYLQRYKGNISDTERMIHVAVARIVHRHLGLRSSILPSANERRVAALHQQHQQQQQQQHHSRVLTTPAPLREEHRPMLMSPFAVSFAAPTAQHHDAAMGALSLLSPAGSTSSFSVSPSSSSLSSTTVTPTTASLLPPQPTPLATTSVPTTPTPLSSPPFVALESSSVAGAFSAPQSPGGAMIVGSKRRVFDDEASSMPPPPPRMPSIENDESPLTESNHKPSKRARSGDTNSTCTCNCENLFCLSHTYRCGVVVDKRLECDACRFSRYAVPRMHLIILMLQHR